MFTLYCVLIGSRSWAQPASLRSDASEDVPAVLSPPLLGRVWKTKTAPLPYTDFLDHDTIRTVFIVEDFFPTFQDSDDGSVKDTNRWNVADLREGP